MFHLGTDTLKPFEGACSCIPCVGNITYGFTSINIVVKGEEYLFVVALLPTELTAALALEVAVECAQVVSLVSRCTETLGIKHHLRTIQFVVVHVVVSSGESTVRKLHTLWSRGIDDDIIKNDSLYIEFVRVVIVSGRFVPLHYVRYSGIYLVFCLLQFQSQYLVFYLGVLDGVYLAPSSGVSVKSLLLNGRQSVVYCPPHWNLRQVSMTLFF